MTRRRRRRGRTVAMVGGKPPRTVKPSQLPKRRQQHDSNTTASRQRHEAQATRRRQRPVRTTTRGSRRLRLAGRRAWDALALALALVVLAFLWGVYWAAGDRGLDDLLGALGGR